jgi:DNA invertase Pin-like site-specific DNA recombinase
LLALIETLQTGDRLMVSELSRLGRSLGQILQIVALASAGRPPGGDERSDPL